MSSAITDLENKILELINENNDLKQKLNLPNYQAFNLQLLLANICYNINKENDHLKEKLNKSLNTKN